jgi:hypothetical protein
VVSSSQLKSHSSRPSAAASSINSESWCSFIDEHSRDCALEPPASPPLRPRRAVGFP